MLSICRTSSWFKPRRAIDVSEEPDWDPDEVSILQEEWNPRALALLKDQPDYAKYRSERVFRFVHLFSGPRDVLKEALETEAKKEGIRVAVESYDKLDSGGHDLSAEHPYVDLVDTAEEIDGYHSGFPCSSFSAVRSREGGPPPVRSREWPHGLPSNNDAQQREADLGAVLAVRPTMLAGKILDSQRAHKVGEVATLESPPGRETGPDIPSWELAELKEFLKAQTAEFNSCIHMEGKQRWWKPARWSGRLQDLETLAGKCQCPSWVSHVQLVGKQKTSSAAEYPATQARKYAVLVVKVFKQNVQLEFRRYKLQTKSMELSKLQMNWVKSREAKTPAPVSQGSQGIGATKAWSVGDANKDSLPSSSTSSKRATREKENEFYLGGMRNPDLAVAKMHMVRQIGADIGRAWNHFLEQNPEAIDIAETYGGGNCEPNRAVGEK